ncbi:MAG: T9SS type A sorting domain-containing protein [candidate division WOR-3 bacterium]
MNLVMTLLPIFLFTQNVRWIYRYDGSPVDVAQCLVYGSDGNIYAAGHSAAGIIVISLTNTGEERWVYRYQAVPDSEARAYSIAYGLDDNIYVAGYSVGEGSYRDLTVISLTNTGEERWVYRYNGPGNYRDVAYSIAYGLDGNIYVAGYASDYYDRKFLVVSLTNTGSERWIYRSNNVGWAYSIAYGLDGNIYAAGFIFGEGGTRDNFAVVSLTTSGIERWVYMYSGPGVFAEMAHSVVYGLDGNIYAGGETQSGGNYYGDFTVISLTNSGNERWVYKILDPGGTERVNSVVYGLDSNIYAAGYGGIPGFRVVSLTSTGTQRWVYSYPDMGEAYSLAYGLDGNIYAAGYVFIPGSGTYEDFTVISLTDTGTERWVYKYNGAGNDWDYAYSLVYGPDGNIYAAGESRGTSTFIDFIVISLEPTLGIRGSENRFQSRSPKSFTFSKEGIILSSNQPIKVKLYNLYGKLVLEKEVTGSERKIEETEKLPPGIYFLSISSGGKELERRKVIKIK